MKSKFNEIYLVAFLVLVSGCSTYQEEDYGDPQRSSHDFNNASKCVNMDSSQEALCKEREHELFISLGASQNCSSPYEYQRNNCINEKAKQKKLLDESLKKHIK